MKARVSELLILIESRKYSDPKLTRRTAHSMPSSLSETGIAPHLIGRSNETLRYYEQK